MADAASTESMPALRESGPSTPSVTAGPRSAIRRFGSWLAAPDSRALVYVGLVFVVLGFAVIAFAWSKVAATLSVPLQIPYIASGSFVGLGLILIGVMIVSIGVKRRENFARIRQIEKISTTMESIRESVSSEEPPQGSS